MTLIEAIRENGENKVKEYLELKIDTLEEVQEEVQEEELELDLTALKWCNSDTLNNIMGV